MGARVSEKLNTITYWFLRTLAWLLTHLVCHYHVRGQKNVPISGALLIVANHLSWYDPLLFAVALPRQVWFFTKAEVFSWPVAGWLCRVTGQIPVHRGMSDRIALEKALQYLNEGRAVVVFPEGTVERQEQMLAAHTGVAMLALRSGATLLAVAHTGTRRILRPGCSWFPRVDIHIGQPYRPALPEGTAHKAALQTITQEVMEHIAEMLPVEQRGIYQ